MASDGRRIDSFFIGGVVPKASLGDLFEALILSNATNVDLKEIIIDSLVPTNRTKARAKLSTAAAPLALPAPSNGKRSSLEVAGDIIVGLLNTKPDHRASLTEIGAELKRAGKACKTKSAVYYYVQEARKKGLVKALGGGNWELAPVPKKKIAKAPGVGTQISKVAKAFADAYPKSLSPRDIKDRVKLGSDNSLYTAIDSLVKRGFITKVEFGQYKHNQSPE